jgi:GMP synthase (glutamine-hydrolysing)
LDDLFRADEDHCEGITLPDQFILLARSRSYDVEAMKHREKDIYGVQFHPETSNEPGRKIAHNFLKLCSPAAARETPEF